MFDLVRGNKRFIQIVLALIVLPFALWGVDSYVNSTGGNDQVATVGKTPITQGEFQQALREQQERLRPQLGGANEALLDGPEVRRGVLQELINQRLLALYAGSARLRVSDVALAGFIAAVPSLQENGKFSRERYEALVAAQGMSVEAFEARVRHDLLMQQALMAVGNAAVAGRLPADRWLDAQLEEREISEIVLRADQFAAGAARPDAAAVQKFYDDNRARFERPEQVRAEYVVLSRDGLTAGVKIGEAEIKAWYQANAARFKQPEQRRASHILIQVAKGAPEADVAAAQAKAARLHAQLKANAADFAKLAKQHSQDPGSADAGGDLGFFGRGMMVKPFEDAAFALAEGQVSDVVRSDFGFHLIKLTGVRAESARPLEEMRSEITAELKRQAGAKAFAEAADGFANIVYEQADSLKPAAEKYGLAVQTTEWLTRGGQAAAPFATPKLMQAVFAADAIGNRRNTEAIDVGGNTLVAARVIEHRPAVVEPLEAVAGMIEKVLAREAAVVRAVAAGQDQLGKLTKGEKVELAWGAARVVSRMHAPNLSDEARAAVFAAVPHTLPAYAGARVPGGFALYRIGKIKPYDAAAGDDAAARGRALRQHYAQTIAQEELLGWLQTLKQRYGVTVNNAAIERK